MRNKIFHINKIEAKEYIKQAEQAQSRIVGIDLKGMKGWSEYARGIEKALEFPRPVTGIPNRFLDWIRDLNWFDNKRYDIYYDYERFILPFWE